MVYHVVYTGLKLCLLIVGVNCLCLCSNKVNKKLLVECFTQGVCARSSKRLMLLYVCDNHYIIAIKEFDLTVFTFRQLNVSKYCEKLHVVIHFYYYL